MLRGEWFIRLVTSVIAEKKLNVIMHLLFVRCSAMLRGEWFIRLVTSVIAEKKLRDRPARWVRFSAPRPWVRGHSKCSKTKYMSTYRIESKRIR